MPARHKAGAIVFAGGARRLESMRPACFRSPAKLIEQDLRFYSCRISKANERRSGTQICAAPSSESMGPRAGPNSRSRSWRASLFRRVCYWGRSTRPRASRPPDCFTREAAPAATFGRRSGPIAWAVRSTGLLMSTSGVWAPRSWLRWGSARYRQLSEGIEAMTSVEKSFEPNPRFGSPL